MIAQCLALCPLLLTPTHALCRRLSHAHTHARSVACARVRSSLKRWKISLYAALGYRPEYVVEGGAHAGSTAERLSVRGMIEDVKAMSPTGLATALRYARGTAGAAAAELDYLAFRSCRQWLAEMGLTTVPRSDTWASLKLWATQRATVAAAPQPDRALFIMYPSTPEPELDEGVEHVADAQNAHTHTHD